MVRAGLGLKFEGGLSMFPQLFMLGDVQLDWTMPQGHLLRFVRIEDDGDFTGMLVCVPLQGPGRYRVATLAPQPLQKTIGSGVVPAGFWQEYTPPTLADIQAVLDDLAPEPTTASNLRWSSIFRIKHGIVDRYRAGRVFVAGDAAHLHPPAGGQGMNTGIQDAWNLGWKLALAVRGIAAPGLLDSYDAERRPAGKAIVDRAVALAFTDEMDMEDEKAQFLLEMQMTMNYSGSALVGEDIGTDADSRWAGAGRAGTGRARPDQVRSRPSPSPVRSHAWNEINAAALRRRNSERGRHRGVGEARGGGVATIFGRGRCLSDHEHGCPGAGASRRSRSPGQRRQLPENL